MRISDWSSDVCSSDLAYVGELSNHDLGTMANFAFGALRSLKYDDLSILLNGDLDGEMVTDIRFGGVGQGEGATRNFLIDPVAKLPFVFNGKINAPFRQPIKIGRASCRERVWQYVYFSGVAVSLKKKQK